MEEEKKVVVAYVVKRFEDDSVTVADAGLEGTTPLSDDEMYKDIEAVSRIIANKRIENAAYVGAYKGTAKFFEDVSKKNKAE